MRSSILPSDILGKRLAILKVLLGPGWLGPRCIEATSSPDQVSAAGWAHMERQYSHLVEWLLPGLTHLCRLGRCPDSSAAVRAHATPRPAATATLPDPDLQTRDVPVALLHALRAGLIVSPSGVRTSCYLTASDLLHGIVPFLAWVYCVYDRYAAASSGRCLVLLAAIPGGGKSVIASLLEQFSPLLKPFASIQSIGMDGWHLRNRVIRVRTITDELGQIVPMATRKGSIETFDVKALTDDMEALVRQRQPVRLPIYDRNLHEPVAEAVPVGGPIVLLEGNYLLVRAQGWERVFELACGAAWLDVPVGLARKSIIDRHMSGGRSLAEAESKWTANDWPNSRIAMRGRTNADVVMYLDARRRVRFVHRL